MSGTVTHRLLFTMHTQPQVNLCTSNLREVERVGRDAYQIPDIPVDAKAFEDEVGRPIFTSALLSCATKEQEHCE
jgi:hypothetical protein